jgi:hypothetical protein
MADKIFKNYQGESIRINGVCYKFVEDTTESVNTSPNDIEATFGSCLACEIEESTSSSSESFDNFSSSTSSDNYSESTSESSQGYTTSSSDSSESIGNVSTSSSSNSSQGYSSDSSMSSESVGNVSSSSESVGNDSSSESLALNCASVEILDIIIGLPLPGSPAYSFNMIFAPGPPLSNFAEGQVCVNGIDIGSLDTGGSSNSIIVQRPTGAPVGYSIGEVVEVCEGECCYLD